MSSPWKLAAWVLVCLGSITAAAQQSVQPPAAHVLGPQWKKMARTAGMIFSATVLDVRALPSAEHVVPVIQLKFQVEHAIAGVEAGQVVTIHEWAGAWAMHRAMHAGEHVLLLLYLPSSLGFTSPVNGAHGQIALDASGTAVATPTSLAEGTPARKRRPPEPVSVLQLARDIRSARGE